MRSTSVDALLPRATGFEGSIAADVFPPRGAVTAGQAYVWSVSVKALSNLSANMLVNYYTQLSGGTFVSNSGPTVPLNLNNGQVARFALGPYTVPATATAGNLKLNDLDGACEVTAYRIAPSTGDFAKDSDYFDGATAGASWDGAAHNSTSTFRVIEDAFTLGEQYTKLQTEAGPYGTDPMAFSETLSIAASSTHFDEFDFIDGFLIASLEFDAARGRVRIDAFTFASNVVSVRVRRRKVAGGQFEDVRGGMVAVLSGFMLRPIDDYEFPSGVDSEYLIEGLGGTGGVLQSARVRRVAGSDPVWLKFIGNSSLNRTLTLIGWSDIERDSRAGVFDVQNRSDPIVVSDVHSSRRFTIEVKAETSADIDALDQALSLGYPCFFQVPPTVPLPTVYAAIGKYSWKPARQSKRGFFSIPLTEIAAPTASAVIEAPRTWQEVLNTYPSWEQMASAVPNWRALVIG